MLIWNKCLETAAEQVGSKLPESIFGAYGDSRLTIEPIK
jgi:hypothetical protein